MRTHALGASRSISCGAFRSPGPFSAARARSDGVAEPGLDSELEGRHLKAEGPSSGRGRALTRVLEGILWWPEASFLRKWMGFPGS